MMGSTHTYEMNIGVAPVGAGSNIEGGVDVTLDPAELDLVGTEAMRAKYEQTLRQQQAARELGLGKEDLSDMVAQHAAKQKVSSSSSIFKNNSDINVLSDKC